jgi:hypothetical protein
MKREPTRRTVREGVPTRVGAVLVEVRRKRRRGRQYRVIVSVECRCGCEVELTPPRG